MKTIISIFFLAMTMCLQAAEPLSFSTHDIADSLFLPKLKGETFIEKKYKGSQYITPEWTKCQILFDSGDTLNVDKARYNGLSDNLIVINGKYNAKIKTDKKDITDFWLASTDSSSTHYKKLSFTENNKTSELSFVEVAQEGKLSFYINRKVIGNGVDNINLNDITIEVQELKPVTKYIFCLKNGATITIKKLKLRSLLRLLPDKKVEINQLINRHHLKFGNENQCQQIVALINKEIL